MTVAEAIATYTPESIEACNRDFIERIRRSCLSDEDYAREYLCEPAKLSQLVSGADYDASTWREVPDNLDWMTFAGPLYVGIDCGRKHDLTVIWVLEGGHDPKALPHFQDVYRTVCVRAMRNTPFPVQEEIIRGILNHPNIAKGYIDQGAQGYAMAESLYGEFGVLCEPIAITAPRKASLCERVRQYIQQQRVGLPRDPKIRQDVLSMRRKATEKGGLTYEGGTRETHADYFLALSLALEAACYGSRLSLSHAEEAEVVEWQPE